MKLAALLLVAVVAYASAKQKKNSEKESRPGQHREEVEIVNGQEVIEEGNGPDEHKPHEHEQKGPGEEGSGEEAQEYPDWMVEYHSLTFEEKLMMKLDTILWSTWGLYAMPFYESVIEHMDGMDKVCYHVEQWESQFGHNDPIKGFDKVNEKDAKRMILSQKRTLKKLLAKTMSKNKRNLEDDAAEQKVLHDEYEGTYDEDERTTDWAKVNRVCQALRSKSTRPHQPTMKEAKKHN